MNHSHKTDAMINLPETFKAIQTDPFVLDSLNVKNLKTRPCVIVTNEPFQALADDVPVKYIKAPALSVFREICSRIPLAGEVLNWTVSLIVALRLTGELKREGAMGLIDLGKHSGSLFCFLNSFKAFQGGPVIVYRVLLPAKPGLLKTFFIKRVLKGTALIVVWSRMQIENYHRAFGSPKEKFFFMPYKANHSKAVSTPMPVGDYIFSGGDSERDYKTLFDAVRGLKIPVIISTRKRSISRSFTIPENVILANAVEPFFERLMGGARLVALCLKSDIIRGSGEATVLNAMWHGKPVIIADNISASEYIENGINGFVVPAGNAEQMRGHIIELWENPSLAFKMGEAGRAKVAKLYTHDQFKARMQTLAMLTFESALK